MQITADKSDSQRYYFGHYLEDSKSKQYRYVGLYYDLFTGVPRIIFLTTKNQKNLQISANWTPKNRTFNFDSAQKDFDAHCISYSIPKDNSQFEKKVEELLLEGIGLMKAMK
jgi:hypothetical protein